MKSLKNEVVDMGTGKTKLGEEEPPDLSIQIIAPKSVIRNWIELGLPPIEKNIPYPSVNHRPTTHWAMMAADMVKGDSVLAPTKADATLLQTHLRQRYQRAAYGRTERSGGGLSAIGVSRRRKEQPCPQNGNREGYRIWLIRDIPEKSSEEAN